MTHILSPADVTRGQTPGREARELVVVHDHDPDYGFAVGAMCVGAARDRGLTVRSLAPGLSIIGRYSIDDEGHTTTTAYGRLAVVDGVLVWDEP